MDNEDREYMRAAILQADIVNEDHECWERERAKQKSTPVLRYRVQEDALIQEQADEPAADYVTFDQLQEVVGIVADEMAAKIAELEAAIADLQSQLQSQKGNVTPMRGKNVA